MGETAAISRAWQRPTYAFLRPKSSLTAPARSGKRPAFQRNPSFTGSNSLVKADLGLKRVCPSCAARFYDLQKRPIECPKCQFSFEPEAMYKQRRPRQPEAAQAQAVPAEAEDEEAENEDEEEEAEAEETVVEPVEGEAPIQIAATGEDEEEEEEAEETETAGAGMSVVDEDDIEDIVVEDDEEEEEDNSLLEEDEDENDDVSGIIDADIEKDER
ncbi:MAG: TIGR02300 family protein [Rhizomicrobium sp.]